MTGIGPGAGGDIGNRRSMLYFSRGGNRRDANTSLRDIAPYALSSLRCCSELGVELKGSLHRLRSLLGRLSRADGY